MVLTGCGMGPAVGPNPSVTLTGIAHGGQQPLSGAHVYLMAAAVSGSVASGNGYGNASVSMLSGTGYSDAVGGYVLTGSNGTFAITGDFNSCTVTGASTNSQVYLYITGGNPGGGTNSASGLLAALGTCGALTSSTSVNVNEVTTIAMAYAVAGFATDATHISIPAYTTGTTPDTLAATGLANAFVNATLLANTGSGMAQTVVANASVYGAGVAPQETVNTLGNILAYCVNSNDISESPLTYSTACQTLLNTATSNGIPKPTSGYGTVPANTATAAIYIAQNPWANVATLTGLIPTNPPFAPALSVSTTPNDLTLGLKYTQTAITYPYGVAIDAAGDAWISSGSGTAMAEISPSGSFLSGSSGYSLGSSVTMQKFPVAIDQSGYVWFMDTNNYLRRYSSAGVQYASSPYNLTGYGVSYVPWGQVAIDASGNAWTSTNAFSASYLTKVTPGGTITETSCGSSCGKYGAAFDGSGRLWVGGSETLSVVNSSGTTMDSSPYSSSDFGAKPVVAIDSSNNAWVGDYLGGPNSVTKVTAGTSGATYAGPYVTTDTAGGLSAIAIDGANHIWAGAGDSSFGVLEVSSAGVSISPSGGYQGGGAFYITSVAIDGSGDVWLVTNGGGATSYSVEELIGAAVPVVTPVVAGLTSPYTPASKP